MTEKEKWILCPGCGNKTRGKMKKDKELKRFPLYCLESKNESLINMKDVKVKEVYSNV